MHPDGTRLRAYALGDLPDETAREVEAHLLSCPACRTNVLLIRDELVRLTEALPPLEPDRGSWPLVQQRVRPGRGRPWLAAAAVALLALGGWGLWQQRVSADLRQDQLVVSGWLARPDVQVLTLFDRTRQPSGRLLLAADHTALFVLPPAPPGQTYHAWVGVQKPWQRGGPLRLVGSDRSGVFQVAARDTDYLCVSLESDSAPTKPSNVLGWTLL